MVGFFDRVRRSDFPPPQYVNRAQEGGFRVAVKDLEAGLRRQDGVDFEDIVIA